MPNYKEYKFSGLAVSPGKANGELVLSSKMAEELGKHKKCVLLQATTEPMDFYGMQKCQAIITSDGSSGSHAAIVSRQLKIPSVVGFKTKHLVTFLVSMEPPYVMIDGTAFYEGDSVSVDGDAGTFTILKKLRKVDKLE